MTEKYIKLEDLDILIPTQANPSIKIKRSKSHKRQNSAYAAEKSEGYDFLLENEAVLTQLEELSCNPHFAAMPAYNFSDRINVIFLEKFTRKWMAGASKVIINMGLGYNKFLYDVSHVERDIHNRWQVGVQEDFSTDGSWEEESSIIEKKYTKGYGDQIQDMAWRKGNGSWKSTTNGSPLIGARNLEHPSTEMRLYCHMDYGSGTTVYDHSGRGHDSTGGTFPDWDTSSFNSEANYCLDFENGSSEYVSFGDHADFSFAGDIPFSGSAWIRIESDIGSNAVIMSKYDTTGAFREWAFFINSPNLELCLLLTDLNEVNWIYFTGITNLSLATWYHVAFTYDGSESASGITLYINGVDDGGTPATGGAYVGMTNTASALVIGATGNPSNYFDGKIDEVRLVAREFTADEVWLMYRHDPMNLLVTGHEWWNNYDVSTWIYNEDVATDSRGMVFGYAEHDHYWLFRNQVGSNTLSLEKDGCVILTNTDYTLAADTWYQFRVSTINNKIKCYLNEDKVFELIDKDRSAIGMVGVYAYTNNTYFDDFRCELKFPTVLNLPPFIDWHNQYVYDSIETGCGTQYQITDPDPRCKFQGSQGGIDAQVWIPLNESEGLPIDHSRNKNIVKLYGGTWVTDSVKDNCISLDGTDDYISINIDGLLDDSTEVTIDFEVYLYENSGDIIACLYRAATDNFLWYNSAATTFTFYNDIDNSNETVSNYTFSEGWYRVTTIINSDSILTYINGKLIGSNSYLKLTVADIDPDYMYLGFDGASSYGQCKLRNLRIFNAVRMDIAYGYDSTPATVFCFDSNNLDDDIAYPIDDNLVLLLHFDEGSGTVTYDASGSGHDATLSTAPDWYDTSFRGEFNTCLDFEAGSSEFLTIGDHADFSFAADIPFSVSAWIRKESVGEQVIISKYDATGTDREWRFYVNSSNKLEVELYDESAGAYIGQTGATTIAINTDYYVAFAYNGGTDSADVALYVNGSDDTDSAHESGSYVAMEAGATDVYIGKDADGDFYDGLMDEVRIFRNKELSADEIESRYRSEPYLYDNYLATRVYDVKHDFKGSSIIHNGLIMISFPNYDVYEQRADNISWPQVFGWYEHSWHLLGLLEPIIYTNYDSQYLADYTGSNWELIDLTDQYAKIKLRYYITDQSGVKEGCMCETNFIIRNGYPGILIETDDLNEYDNEYIGFMIRHGLGYGTGHNLRFYYSPHNQLHDVDTNSDVELMPHEISDNWSIVFGDAADSDADNKNVIIGYFSDSMQDETDFHDASCVLVAHMDENADTTVYDESDLGHHSNDFTTPAWATGMNNSGLDFELGDSDRLAFGDHDDFSFNDGATCDQAFSVEFWVKFETLPGTDEMLVAKYDWANAYREWDIHVSTADKINFRLFQKDAAGNRITRYYNTPLSTGIWYYVVCTYDGSEDSSGMDIYLNAVAVDDGDDSAGTYPGMSNTPSVLSVGAFDAGGWNAFLDGIIDELKIHHRCLSADEIQSRYRTSFYYNMFDATDSGNDFTEVEVGQCKYGGIFFVPYDVDNLFQEADSDDAEVTTDGANDQSNLAGYTGDGYIRLTGTAGEYAQWNVGTLNAGTYVAVFRLASEDATITDREFWLYVDNDNDHDGDLVAEFHALPLEDHWYRYYVQFYTDGTNDVYISVENKEAADDIYVDSFACIPQSNLKNYPNDLSKQAFVDVHITRGASK